MFKVLWKNTAKIIHQDIIEHKIVYPPVFRPDPNEDRSVGGWLGFVVVWYTLDRYNIKSIH